MIEVRTELSARPEPASSTAISGTLLLSRLPWSQKPSRPVPARGGVEIATDSVRASTVSSVSHPVNRAEPDDDYCVDCGHDHHPNHRGGRCWTDALGNAIERTPTKIACTCKQFQAAPER